MERKTAMNIRQMFAGVLVAASISSLALGARQNDRPTPPQTKKAVAARHAAAPVDEGQRVFEQNCSRCHTAPDGFSQSISATVVRHMRVRASLSEHDEEALLKFFNP
jgi:mono/diheme cytochrome c family protein